MLDTHGRLVGLCTCIAREGHGLGFAIPAMEVWKYVAQCFKQLSEGSLLLPADELISRSAPAISTHELIAGAVRSSGLRWRTHDGGVQIVTTPGGHDFWVSPTAGNFLIHHYIGDLRRHRHDAELLFHLLKINFELNGPTFQIDAKNALCLAYSRPLEGLDMNEARTSLFEFADALDEHLPDICQRLNL